MNFIEHLTKPVIGVYCYDFAPIDMTTFRAVNLNFNQIYNFNFIFSLYCSHLLASF